MPDPVAVPDDHCAPRARRSLRGHGLILPFRDLERLKAALLEADAEPRLVADIEVAAWCDLVIAAITHNEDTSCLIAASREYLIRLAGTPGRLPKYLCPARKRAPR
jgi:hypothetical protein